MSQISQWDRHHVWHPFTAMQQWCEGEVLVIDRAEGNQLIDSEGRRYIDGVSSLWVNVHGHNRPEINAAIEAARAGFPNLSVPIPALYDGTVMRESHLRPFHDISRIVRMVGWKLLSRGMYPQGLWRALSRRTPRARSRP